MGRNEHAISRVKGRIPRVKPGAKKHTKAEDDHHTKK